LFSSRSTRGFYVSNSRCIQINIILCTNQSKIFPASF